MSRDFVPKSALNYLKQKKLTPAFSYKDVWNEEHNHAFTVAKAMQVDVLTDIHKGVVDAVADGQTFEQFKKELAPLLEQKGWWGKQKMKDPLTGEIRDVQSGSNRRLKTIYNTNLRTAHSKGQFDRGMNSSLHTHIIYRIGPSTQHRKQHLSWDGLTLPKDDPFWGNHLPPNGWGCRCYFSFLTKQRLERYKEDGVADFESSEKGFPNKQKPINQTRPKVEYKTVVNKRRGEVYRVPNGVDPAFAWNPGQNGAEMPLFTDYLKKSREQFADRWEGLAESIIHNRVKRDQWQSFTERAMKGEMSPTETSAVGFFNQKVVQFLKRRKVNVKNGTIGVEARLLSGKKAQRHTTAGDALSLNEWKGLIDIVLAPDMILWDKADGVLLYVREVSKEQVIKVVVKPNWREGKQGTNISYESVRTAFKVSKDSLKRFEEIK